MAGGLGAVSKRVRRAICGLLGHDTLLHFDEHRLWLQCVTCGYQTTGWTIGDIPSRAEVTTSPPLAPIETRHAA
jgi:hypothetical protein